MNSYPIVDVTFIALIEKLDEGWGIWECEALLEDGTTVTGSIQGDGVLSAAHETFQPLE